MVAATYAPDELLRKYRDICDALSVERFFRAPGMSRIREMWCAAHFSRTYEEHIAPCVVRIDDHDSQDDFDFELGVADRWHLFQVAEVMEPDRRRSAEYGNFADGGTRSEDWGRGTRDGPEWINMAIQRKLEKKYGRVSELNLLLYLNFAAYKQPYIRIREHCAAELEQFLSIWLLNGNALCSLKPSASLGTLEGWHPIPTSVDIGHPQ
ncbi:MAG: hypothetical protein CV081_11130 [Nitrospira sp. LK265]|nr:hypothetical protein [Nitrospira sp. LK265]